ncbi:hypothetical protein [Rhodoligotrophos defluvii]|uniref:ATP-binding protein n=1 Tax=Rhodoligotrophos defluvii TaxID=2561934 RepID=UPI0010C9E37C|nr:hypothetical protein [Rhodoligotrophos defluvii]
MNRGVLILGNHRPALTAARALHRQGYRVVLSASSKAPFAEYSRAVDELWYGPEPAACDFATQLAAYSQRTPDLIAVLPVNEPMLEALVADRDVLARLAMAGVRAVMPKPELVALCHDKIAMLELVRGLGLGCPPFAVAETPPALNAAAASTGFPLVIRPLRPGTRIGELKAVTVASEEALKRLPAKDIADAGPLLLQRFFEGGRYNVCFAARNGEIIDSLHIHNTRTDRADGTGLAVEGVTIAPVPELAEDTAEIVRSLKYTGVGCAQYLFDEASRARCFLEINPRFDADYSVVEAAGLPLTALAMRLAGAVPGEDGQQSGPKPKRCLRFVWTYGDLAGLWFSLRGGLVGAGGAIRWLCNAMVAAFRADVHVTWDWRDPKPTIMAYLGRIIRWLKPRAA